MSSVEELKIGTPGEPLEHDERIVALPTCKVCAGRGWFLINPFATGGSNGAGGIRNMTQCANCYRSHEYFQQHGRLPEESEANHG